jgi:hypothetical protein
MHKHARHSVHGSNLIWIKVALAGGTTTGVAFDFLGIVRGLSQGLGNMGIRPSQLRDAQFRATSIVAVSLKLTRT